MPPYFRQALPAALSIAFLEVSVDTAAGRFRQNSPAISRLLSGRHLVHWVDQKNGTPQIVGRVLDEGLTPLTSDFFLYTDDVERDVSDLAAGSNGQRVTLIWRNGQLGNIGMALVDSQSTVLISHLVNDGPPTPFVASPDATGLFPSSFMTAWEEFRGGWRIMGQPFDSAGVRLGSNLNLDGGTDSILRLTPALAADTAGGYLVAWSEGSASRCDIYVRLFDAGHTAKGPAFALTAPVGTESYMVPAVTYMESTDEFWVLYVQTDVPTDSTALFATRLTPAGVVTDSAWALSAGPYPWEPAAAVSANRLVAFTGRFDNQGEIRALSLDAAGTITDSSVVISTSAIRERGAVSSSSGSDTLAVVWQDRQGGEYDIHVLQRENFNSVAADAKINVEGPGGQQFGADVTRRGGGGVHAVFTDTQLDDGDICVVDVNDAGTILSRRIANDDGTLAPQYDAHIASDSTGWALVTWTDQRADWTGPAIHAGARYLQAGIPVAPAFRVADDSASTAQSQTDVTMHTDKTAAVVWVDDRATTTQAFVRWFDPTGNPLAVETALNNGAQSQLLISLERDPTIAVDSLGNYWTAWNLLDVITDSFYVVAQAWSGAGARLGTNINLSPAGPTADALEFDLAALPDGTVRIVWNDPRPGSEGIQTATYDTGATVITGPLRVSNLGVTASDPAVRVDASGRWSVIWSEAGGLFEHVVWQRFDAGGTPSAGTEQISSFSNATRRRNPAITYSGNFQYGIWHDNESGGFGFNVRLSSLLKSAADVASEEDVRPEGFTLYPNYPNPFNADTRIAYELSYPSAVELTVYDGLGRHVTRLVKGVHSPGRYEVRWDGTRETGEKVASGVYFFRLKTDQGWYHRKMVLLK